MILIDRNDAEQIIVLSLNGEFDGVLHLKNDSTRKIFTVSLDNGVSTGDDRAKFIEPTESFSLLPEGFYSYTAGSMIDEAYPDAGKLLVLPTQSQPLPSAEDVNNILVFTK